MRVCGVLEVSYRVHLLGLPCVCQSVLDRQLRASIPVRTPSGCLGFSLLEQLTAVGSALVHVLTVCCCPSCCLSAAITGIKNSKRPVKQAVAA